MGTETYLRTWRHLRVRFYTAAFISFVCFLLNIGFLVGRKQALFALAAWFGAEVAWTVLFIVWVMWFKCPRCRRNFSFSSKRNRGKTCGVWHSGGLAPTADKVWQIRHDRLAGNVEAIAKVVPECEAKFGSGAHQSEECVAAVAAIETASTTTDLALGDMEADVALGAIGVERYLRPIEHHQQLRLFGVQPHELLRDNLDERARQSG